MSQLHEECGVFGIYAGEQSPVAQTVLTGLYALQHRGQESGGIVVCNDGLFTAHKDLGLLSDVFTDTQMQAFPEGTMAIGHVRYGTSGETTRENAQPMKVNHHKGHLALAHNGNLSNAWKLREKLENGGAIFHSTNDTEIIAYLAIQNRLKTHSIEEAVLQTMNQMEGAYSLIFMSPTKLIAMRDPHGFRPLCIGKLPDGSVIVCSESCALNAVGAEFIRDIEPGEMICLTRAGARSCAQQLTDSVYMVSNRSHCGIRPHKICIFEYIYFARPDSVIEGISVHEARKTAGAVLAKTSPVEADLVVGVPDSGLDAALGYAKESGIPYGMGFVKSKYIGRTFISPGQDARMKKVRIKLNPIASEVKGKRIVLIDDSIVRGTTSACIVSLLREAGAKEVHLRITAPPFRHACYYGTDIDSSENLIANHHTPEEIARIVGADSLAFLPLQELPCLVGHDSYCAACFDGNYPTQVPGEGAKNRYEQPLSAKKHEAGRDRGASDDTKSAN